MGQAIAMRTDLAAGRTVEFSGLCADAELLIAETCGKFGAINEVTRLEAPLVLDVRCDLPPSHPPVARRPNCSR